MKELNKSDVMKRIILIMCCFLSVFAWADDGRTTISLNGEWDFDQTELAFPPRKYTRKIPVPGLVHLARPKISQYEKFFKKPDGVELVEQFNFLEREIIRRCIIGISGKYLSMRNLRMSNYSLR